MASTPDYTILHAPRITEAKFASILRAGNSPAYPDAPACYRACVSRGVDPAVLLAIFRKESSFGRAGRARTSRSWGNLRRSPDYPTVNGFVNYPSWSAGASDAARLLAIYGRNQIRKGKNTSTVQTMPYVWAPASDGNGPDRYGDQLAKWIHDWTGQAGDVAGAVAAVTGSPSSSVGQAKTAGALLGEPLGAFYLNGRALVTYPRGSTAWTANAIVAALHQANWFGQGGLFPPLDVGAGASEDLARTIFKSDEGKTWNEALHKKWVSDFGGMAAIAGDPGKVAGAVLDPIVTAIGAVPEALGKALQDVATLAAILGLIVLAIYRIAKA